jgi:hypothetical protein
MLASCIGSTTLAVYGEQTLRTGLVSEIQPSETLREEMLPGFH